MKALVPIDTGSLTSARCIVRAVGLRKHYDSRVGVWDWFRRRGGTPRPPADLRDALLAATGAKDDAALAELVHANRDAIRTLFPEWATVPAEIRNNPGALERYAQTLFMVASLFEHAGDSSLMTRLRGDNPMDQWDEDLANAQRLIDARRPTEAVTVLKTLLESLDAQDGNAVDYYRPRVLGRLGTALVQTGDTREAVKVTRQALELCRSAGDEEGVRIYTANLEAIGTYEIPARDGTDGNVTVAFSDEQGQTLTLEELKTATGRVRWEVRGGPPVPAEARRLHEEGRAAGGRGDYEAAVSLLTQAAQLAPSWPYPVYDRAFTQLLLRDFDAALRDYRRTVELSPGGFFTAEVALDTLTRESAGEFPPGLYAAFVMFEDLSREEQSAFAAQLVEQVPSFAPGWNEHADFVPDAVQCLESLEHGLAARPDPQTRGLLMVKKAVTMSRLGDVDAATGILQRLASESTPSLSTRVAAEFALTRLSSGPST